MNLPGVFRFRIGRAFALAAALAVLGVGLIIAVVNENALSDQKLRELDTQARILAQSVAAPVMFSDSEAAQENAGALAENPEVESAAVYSTDGDLLASFQRQGALALPTKPIAQAPAFQGDYREIVRPVVRDGQTYGHVFLRLTADPILVRLQRYAPIGLIFLLTALVLFVVGSAQGALRSAYDELEQKAADLTSANDSLEKEIANRKSVEEDLVQSRKMEAIGQLTGGVAHDFNNLLQVVSGGIMMLSRHSDPDRRKNVMEAMKQAVERGAGLTKQLLAFARRQPAELQTVDVAARLHGMRQFLERSLRADILLEISIPELLPAVKTDPGQLELAILNLCVNAPDAMPKGGVITISAQPGARADRVELLIKDSGAGIPPELLRRIFEPYFTTKPVGQGTGLGLAQVYGFCQQSGGDVRVESVVGVGTTVLLSLPISSDQLAVAAKETAPAQGAIQQRRILVVEDEDSVAATVCVMLDELGHQSRRVSSAAEALALVRTETSFDLVFSDIIMPGGKSGIELANELERTAPSLPVLLTSGYSGPEGTTARRPILHKPYQIDQLRAAIETAITEASAERATVA